MFRFTILFLIFCFTIYVKGGSTKDSLRILHKHTWRTSGPNWFWGDTVILRSISKPDSLYLKSKRMSKYFYRKYYGERIRFNDSGLLIFSDFYPCPVVAYNLELNDFKLTNGKVYVDFKKISRISIFLSSEGKLYYKIIKWSRRKIILVKEKTEWNYW